MIKQKKLVMIVSAFFSVKYFLNRDRSMDKILFIRRQR